jgi:hypothetical protein
MKKALNYPELWQQKRNELPVEGDPNADWLLMQAALEAHLPVTRVIKKPYNPKGLKGLYKLLIGFSTAAVIYGSAQLYLSKNRMDPVKAIPQKSTPAVPAPVKKDSAALITGPNSLPAEQPKPGGKIPAAKSGLAPDRKLIPAGKITPADSVIKEAGTGENGIVHRDSVLSPLSPASALPGADSAGTIKTAPVSEHLDSKAAQKAAPGNIKPQKKKRNKLQVFF